MRKKKGNCFRSLLSQIPWLPSQKNMKSIVYHIIKKTIDNDIKKTITTTLPDTQNDDDNEFRADTLDSNNDDIISEDIYIEDDYAVQDPENMEIKINLKRKNEPNENKIEQKFIKDNRENYININHNIDRAEMKNMF